MGVFRNLATLLMNEEPVTGAQTGRTCLIVVDDSSGYCDGALDMRVFIDLGQAGGEGSPSVNVVVETSWDGNYWIPVIEPVEGESSKMVSKFLGIEALGPYVRARTSLSGTTPPQHLARVILAGSSPFRLELCEGPPSGSQTDSVPPIA